MSFSNQVAYLVRSMPSGNIRYYQINLLVNLFDEFILERIFGAEKNSRPTGVITKIYTNPEQANRAFDDVLKKKYRRGYIAKKEFFRADTREN